MEEHIRKDAPGKAGPHILGKSIMEQVHRDEASTLYPVGINKPPPKWGSTEHGKLSADQNYVVGTKSLVVTLVRRWGYPENASRKESQRMLQMLHNYADLVKATLMFQNRVTSAAHADSYIHHMLRFFQQAGLIHHRFAMRPSGHIALHYDDFLRSFGPSHAFETPAFERINYVLQSSKTNMKLGRSLIIIKVFWN